MTVPITFRGYHLGAGDIYVIPDRITHFDRLERGGTRIVLDTGKEVWVDAWPQDVAAAIGKAQCELQTEKLSLRPGDILAATVQIALSPGQYEHLIARLQEAAPSGVKVVVLDRGATLQVVQAPQQPEGEAR